jgi:hypothetical protein
MFRKDLSILQNIGGKMENGDIWYKILDAALQLPGAKVDRAAFLKKVYTEYFNNDMLDKMILENSIASGIGLKIMDKAADEAITYHQNIATSLSFVAGIPGGLTMLATVPADIAQYYYHLIVCAQKIAYLYGMADLGVTDDNLKSLVTLLIGVMADNEEADKTINEMYSEQFKKSAGTLVVGKAFNKIIITIAVSISYILTGKAIFKSIFKVIPLLGGVVSGGITLFSFKPMCSKLKERMHKSTETISKELSTKLLE